MTLQEFFQENPVVALAFSGGVDSSYLLYEAKNHCKRLGVYTARTAFVPAFEREDADRLANELGVPVTVLELDPLSVPGAAANGPDRCYHCKKAVFTAITQKAKEDGFPLVIDGTNASDDASDRPGMRALAELGVRSPLRECGITKAQVRKASKEAGLFTWDKPAYACLATRVPTGTPITRENLARIERGEKALMDLGFSDFRLRLMGNFARLQLNEAQIEGAFAARASIIAALTGLFEGVALDLQPRTSSPEE
ncbi:MAG: ATP-dependent sacrificial sulfur transferase LarE [Christensenellales bacterium]|jgi:uncharacterized protein